MLKVADDLQSKTSIHVPQIGGVEVLCSVKNQLQLRVRERPDPNLKRLQVGASTRHHRVGSISSSG